MVTSLRDTDRPFINIVITEGSSPDDYSVGRPWEAVIPVGRIGPGHLRLDLDSDAGHRIEHNKNRQIPLGFGPGGLAALEDRGSRQVLACESEVLKTTQLTGFESPSSWPAPPPGLESWAAQNAGFPLLAAGHLLSRRTTGLR